MNAVFSPRDFRLDDPEIQKDPYPYYPTLREQAPVMETDFAGQPCWVVSRRADVDTVLMNPALYSSRTTPLPNLLFADPTEHTRLRQMVGGMFTRMAVAGLEEGISERAAALAAPLAAAGQCDVVGDFAGPLTIGMIGLILGINVDQVERLRALTHARAEAVLAMRLGKTPSENAQRANVELLELMRALSAPGAHVEGGVVAALAEQCAQGALTEEQFVAFVVLLFAAGHSTTTNLIANAIYMLTQRPDLLKRLRADESFAAPFIEEVLRMRPSFHRLQRVTTQAVELGDVAIPAGAVVRVLIASANRDPEFYEDAETFDPDQSRRAHIAFGRGIHTCLGSWLARLEALVALKIFVGLVDGVSLDPERSAVPLSGGTFNEFGFSHLPVRLRPRAE